MLMGVLIKTEQPELLWSRGVMAWRRWLTTKANGGPVYPIEDRLADPFRDSLGKLRRRELLDRYTQHTQHCAACSRVCTLLMHSICSLQCTALLLRYHIQRFCWWSFIYVLKLVCAQALNQVQMAEKVLLGFCAAAFLSLATFLGQGSQLTSAGPLASAAAIPIGLFLYTRLQALERQFIFTDWVNAEK